MAEEIIKSVEGAEENTEPKTYTQEELDEKEKYWINIY